MRKGSLRPQWTWAKATLGGRRPPRHGLDKGTPSFVIASTRLLPPGDSVMESTESLCTSHPPATCHQEVLRDGSLNDKGRPGARLPMQSNPNCAWLCCSKTKSLKAVSSQKVALTTPLKPGSPAHPPHSTQSSGSCLKDVTPEGDFTVCEVRAGDEQPREEAERSRPLGAQL